MSEGSTTRQQQTPAVFEQADAIAEAIIQRVGRHIVLALPLGLGKANHIANALTQRALADNSITLDIITALTLEIPEPGSDFQRRLLEPALERLFGDYPALDYAKLLRSNQLPENISVSEFFVAAGQWLQVASAQQAFIPANYTHALQYILDRKVNVIAQLLAEDETGNRYSLSCNPDISVDLLKQRSAGNADFLLVGQCNSELPFMSGDAEIDGEQLDFLLRSQHTDFELFGTPKQAVTIQDYAIGLHTAQLVRDGGTLQIGIGSIGDAVARALILRHQQPDQFASLMQNLDRLPAQHLQQRQPFDQGLYGLSEMFVDGFLQLYEAGILKRKVDDAVLHGAFFLDSRSFYQRLRKLPQSTRDLFQMRPVSFTNDLYENEDEKRQARVKASFINSAMMATVRGAIISDALEDGRVISGVGGQYNFASQAFALQDARFIVTLRATRLDKGSCVSNIVWSYGHATIPWHLRDIVVTEYGVADLRGKTETEAIQAMIKVCDSRFQEELLDKARSAGKIDRSWRIPQTHKQNFPSQIEHALGRAYGHGVLSPYPFGTEFSAEERRLISALQELDKRQHSKLKLGKLLFRSVMGPALNELELNCLQRMDLHNAQHFQPLMQKWLLTGALLLTRAAPH